VPDRFDLMERVDVLSALRISSSWCQRVNRSGLTDVDLSRLVAGAVWLDRMTAEVERMLRHEVAVEFSAFDQPPALAEAADSLDAVVDRFREVNDGALTVLAALRPSEWTKSTPYLPGVTTSIEHLARHVARVSQSASVDQRWIW